jgi:predicted CXXCH cytochrome family protein
MIQLLYIDLFICLSFPLKEAPGKPDAVQSDPTFDCLECHIDLVNKDMKHYPAEDACDNCHEATGATHPSGDSLGFRLMDSSPALCYYCHEESEALTHTHTPMAEGQCLGCHDAHASSWSSLLCKSETELCLSCHDREYGKDGTGTDNIRLLISGSQRVVHTAITEMGCTTCHQAHGSDLPSLLVDSFPEEEYVPAASENFGLCFLCHDADILEAEETEWATGFRQGKQNLHRVHIQGNKGRNCRMCHNIHGSSQPFLIEESVKFGNWEMPLNFVADPQGGSCLTGCHKKLSYSREITEG